MNRNLPFLLLAFALTLASPSILKAQPPIPQPVNIGQTLSTLADQPATHTGFVFDRSMMQMAQNLLESNGMDAHRAAAAIYSVLVDSYRYPQPAFYTPEAMDSLVSTYHAAGWKHLVNANEHSANAAQPTHTITDLWLHFTGTDIDGVTVLSRGVRNMSVIRLSCDLRPLDLVHLSGHFGIPKVDPNAVMVPAPNGK
jgi:hypothetical protein